MRTSAPGYVVPVTVLTSSVLLYQCLRSSGSVRALRTVTAAGAVCRSSAVTTHASMFHRPSSTGTCTRFTPATTDSTRSPCHPPRSTDPADPRRSTCPRDWTPHHLDRALFHLEQRTVPVLPRRRLPVDGGDGGVTARDHRQLRHRHPRDGTAGRSDGVDPERVPGAADATIGRHTGQRSARRCRARRNDDALVSLSKKRERRETITRCR